MSEWQPIETAPRDGTQFLAIWQPLGATAPQIIIAKHTRDFDWPRFVGVNVQDGQGHGTVSSLEWGFPKAVLLATHWMPLPQAPA